jgi:CTP:molybdopterin cytidylyltransferase MocA
LQLKSPSTLRDFLSVHARQIRYLPVDTPSVLSDIDTPEDYRRQLPKLGIE